MSESANDDLTYPEICTDLVKTLLETGYVAVGRGLQVHAEDIFNGLIAARPESELPVVGLSVCKMSFGDFATATALLTKQALAINPSSEIAKCFLGVVSHYCGAAQQSLSIMSDLISNGTDETAINIAKNVVNEINSR
ncbi:MAG: hypothetical protein LBJ94_02930 [Puniceicoccales bacterium]|jgi:hypothetical protein|nr:hypothetical protein [Puniceicoccales bacterium]